MAVKFYCGGPGSGKSYHVVKEVIIPALKEGRKTLTNLPVKLDMMAAHIPELRFVQKMGFLSMIDDPKIRDIHLVVANEEHAGHLIVIDEAHNYWPAGEPVKDKGFRKWYTEHRHYFQDIVLVTQDYENVSKFMRSLMDCRFQYSKNDDLGLSNSYNEDYYMGKSRKKPVRSMYTYDKFYFQFYSSHSQDLGGRGLRERRVGKKVNVLLKWLVIIVVCVFLAFFSLWKLFSGYAALKTEPGQQGAVSGAEKNNEGVRQGGFSYPAGAGAFAPGAGSGAKEPELRFDWCVGSVRVNAGVGAKQDKAPAVKLTPYLVAGIIGVGLESVYLLKAFSGSVVNKRIHGSPYDLGDKVCF